MKSKYVQWHNYQHIRIRTRAQAQHKYLFICISSVWPNESTFCNLFGLVPKNVLPQLPVSGDLSERAGARSGLARGYGEGFALIETMLANPLACKAK